MPYQPTSKLPTASQVLAIVKRAEDKALKDTGRYVQAKAAKYPAKADSSTYKRTGTLGRSITVSQPQATGNALYVEVGTNIPYARYVEEGTGIYGPKGQKIKPKSAKVLAWRSTGAGLFSGSRSVLIAAGISKRKGRIVSNAKRDIYLNFARSVRGMRPWHYMQNAFEDPESNSYFEARCQQAATEIATALRALSTTGGAS